VINEDINQNYQSEINDHNEELEMDHDKKKFMESIMKKYSLANKFKKKKDPIKEIIERKN